MTKIIRAKYRRSRQLGESLWGDAKDPVNKGKNYRPGQHGPTSQKKLSDYGKQLSAKQKVRSYYGLSEKQFKNTFAKASNMKGDTGENLIGLLESRLDIVVYRLNLAPTIFSAKQIVSHKHVKVNGKLVNISSYKLKDSDVVEIVEKSKNLLPIESALASMTRDVPEYLSLDQNAKSGKFLRKPGFAEVPYACNIEPQLVVEYYSR